MSNTKNTDLTFESLKKQINNIEEFEQKTLPIGITAAAVSTIGASAIVPIFATVGISGVATTAIAGLTQYFKIQKKKLDQDLQISLEKRLITQNQYDELKAILEKILVAK